MLMVIHTHVGSHTHKHVLKTGVLYSRWFSHTNAHPHTMPHPARVRCPFLTHPCALSHAEANPQPLWLRL